MQGKWRAIALGLAVCWSFAGNALANSADLYSDDESDFSALSSDGALGMQAIKPAIYALGPIMDAPAGDAQERIYTGLLPTEEFNVVMETIPDQNGSTECVQLIKSLLAAPRTIFWKPGRSLKEEASNIAPGTAIATFVNGQYPQHGRTGMHAAIFVRATQAGIYVLDQFRTAREVRQRFIPWHNNSSSSRSNNASAYSTIRW